nr:hypothetical protein [Tanacetum cinerariifolium]
MDLLLFIAKDVRSVQSIFINFSCSCGNPMVSSRGTTVTLMQDLGGHFSSDAPMNNLISTLFKKEGLIPEIMPQRVDHLLGEKRTQDALGAPSASALVVDMDLSKDRYGPLNFIILFVLFNRDEKDTSNDLEGWYKVGDYEIPSSEFLGVDVQRIENEANTVIFGQ